MMRHQRLPGISFSRQTPSGKSGTGSNVWLCTPSSQRNSSHQYTDHPANPGPIQNLQLSAHKNESVYFIKTRLSRNFYKQIPILMHFALKFPTIHLT
jgi:hypothetical protein